MSNEKLDLGIILNNPTGMSLIPCQRKKVKQLWDSGQWRISDLARVFRVSFTTIKRIIDLEYAARQTTLKIKYRVYDRKRNTKAVRLTRARKREQLVLMGNTFIRRRKDFSIEESKHHRAVIVLKNGNTINWVTSYSSKEAALRNKNLGKLPEGAIVTTWAKLRRYKEAHPDIKIGFQQ